jgi:hypothetical protein
MRVVADELRRILIGLGIEEAVEAVREDKLSCAKLTPKSSSKLVSSPWFKMTTSTFFASQIAKMSSAPKRSSRSLQ